MALVCKMGIVACTLVHFFNLQHPGNTAREEFTLSHQRSSIGLAFASLATTLFCFTLNLVGTSQALAAVRQAVVHIGRIRGCSKVGNAVAPV